MENIRFPVCASVLRVRRLIPHSHSAVMAGLIETIFHWLTPDVIVDVSRDLVVFQCEGRVEKIEPVLWVVGQGREARVVGVGANPVLTKPAKRIELFGGDWNGSSDREHLELVDAFCRYGLVKVIGRRIPIRPTVLARIPETVPESEKQVLQEIFRRTFERAGAHEVRWG